MSSPPEVGAPSVRKARSGPAVTGPAVPAPAGAGAPPPSGPPPIAPSGPPAPWGPAVYRELRRVADLLFVKERRDHTLQPTALVHEVFLRLDRHGVALPGRRCEALAYAATVMRNLLVEYARGRAAQIRGGDRARVPLGPEISIDDASVPDVLALHEAIARLAVSYPREARVVELRFFGGMSTDEIAEVIDRSPKTVRGDWRIAKARLARILDEAGDADGTGDEGAGDDGAGDDGAGDDGATDGGAAVR